MNKIKILVKSQNVIFDDEGRPMSHGNEYIVSEGKKIESYISRGIVFVVKPEGENQQAEEQKQKPLQIKNSGKQDTASINLEENSNG
jgi:hypothetical protein